MKWLFRFILLHWNMPHSNLFKGFALALIHSSRHSSKNIFFSHFIREPIFNDVSKCVSKSILQGFNLNDLFNAFCKKYFLFFDNDASFANDLLIYFFLSLSINKRRRRHSQTYRQTDFHIFSHFWLLLRIQLHTKKREKLARLQYVSLM